MASDDILGTQWFSPMPPWPGIGMVAVEGRNSDWGAYIGCYSIFDTDPDVSAREIARRGSRLDHNIALTIWPHLADCGLKYREHDE